MRIVLFSLLLVLPSLLGGCTAAYVAGGAGAWVGSEVLTDQSPLDHAAAALRPSCETLTIYDQPPHCRR